MLAESPPTSCAVIAGCERDSTRQPRRQIAATIHTKLMGAVKQVLGVSHTHTGSTRTVTRRSGERAHYLTLKILENVVKRSESAV